MHQELEELIQRLSDSWRACLRKREEKVACCRQATSAGYRSRTVTAVWAAVERMAGPYPCPTMLGAARPAEEEAHSVADPPLRFLCWSWLQTFHRPTRILQKVPSPVLAAGVEPDGL